MTELAPKRTSFLFSRIAGAAIGATVLALILAIAALVVELPALVGLGLVLWVFLVALSVWTGSVAWRKERYEIHEGHLVARAGGVASDRTTELDVKNITHVKQRLSWIRYRFFDVGDVIVQSAGSSNAEVVFRSVRHPDEVYDRVRALMRDNGFSMRGERLLHSETPSTVGVVVECISIALGLGAFVSWAGASLVGVVAALGVLGAVLAVMVSGLMGLGLLAFLVLHFLDMKRRTYEVYDDIVEYREGFLSRTNAFIPYENIADAATKQTFIDQLLGLYDVNVSCQGSGAEVAFRRLADGPKLQAVLRGRVEAAQGLREQRKKQQQERQAEREAAQPTTEAARASRPPAEIVPADQAWTARLRMNTPRAFFGGALLRALGTTYTVGPSSVASRFALLGQQQLEFAYDKVTGVQVRTSPWDGLFGTMTVRIWSIGSSTPLDLAHVDRDAVDLPALLRQAGVPGGPARQSLPAAFGLGVWSRAHVGTVLWLLLIALGTALLAVLEPVAAALTLGLLALAVPSLALAAARARRQRFTFHEHHMEHQAGLLWRHHLYVRYDDVKKIAVQRYYGTEAGRITVFVAGETRLQTNQGKAGAIVPNTFTAHYLPDVTPLARTMDLLLQGRIDPEQILEAGPPAEGPAFRPAVANTALSIVLFGCLLPPLWLFLPYGVLSVKRRVYRVEAERAVLEEGVLYRTHTSVLFERIDSLEQGQGFLGKAFGNGSVTLYTAGSSRPDLVLSNTPGYTTLYKAIRERYGA